MVLMLVHAVVHINSVLPLFYECVKSKTAEVSRNTLLSNDKKYLRPSTPKSPKELTSRPTVTKSSTEKGAHWYGKEITRKLMEPPQIPLDFYCSSGIDMFRFWH